MEKEFTFTVLKNRNGIRLDVFVSESVDDVSRSKAKKLIDDGHVIIDGKKAKASHTVHAGESVKVIVPPPEEPSVEPEKIPLEVIHEDEYIVVVNKPPGMVVHPAAGNFSHTLVNALVGRGQELSDGTHPLRPGIVHRLDKDTSGCIVVAKDDVTHGKLSELFSSRNVYKEYRAIVSGKLKKDKGEIKTLIDRSRRDRKMMAVAADRGREAITLYEAVERFEYATHAKLVLKTGRTHQIRVHMTHLGHPVLGDKTYSRGRIEKELGLQVPRQMLHAYLLGFTHPETGREVQFEAPFPDDFLSVLNELRKLDIK